MSKVTFQQLSTFTAALALCLAALLSLAPDVIYWLFGLTTNDATDLMAKRAAGLFLGYVVLSWRIRNTAPSEARRSISLAMMTMMLVLAGLSFYEFLRGFAGPGILLAAATECILAALYFRHSKT